MTSRQAVTQESTRFKVMRLLQENPEMTQREIAEEVGISLGGVNYCLRALVDKGLVKIHNFQSSRNKLGYVYLLTPKGIAQKSVMTAQFLKRKIREYEELKNEIAALEAEVSVEHDVRQAEESNLTQMIERAQKK